MRVLHLFNRYGAASEGAWHDMVHALPSHGVAVDIAAETDARPPIRGSDPVLALPRFHVTAADDVDAQMRALADRAEAMPVFRELLGRRHDVVHGHFGTRVLHGAAWLRRGVPMVVSLYGYDASRLLRDPCWAARYRWAAARGATFVVLCDDMQQRLRAVGVPSRVIHLGIHTDQWPYRPRPLIGHPRFVFVGRLTAKKSPLDAIAAVQRLREVHDVDATLEVIGDGPQRDAVASRAGPWLHFRDWVDRDDLPDTLRGAAALILPSATAPDGDAEGTPVVLMEAQALGVPCITTRHAGNADVLPSGADLLAAEHDPAGLADAMHRVATMSPTQRLALQQRGRAWVEQHFSLDRAVREHVVLYRCLSGSAIVSSRTAG